jgi:hypothetical protein
MIEHTIPDVTVRPVTREEYDEWYHHSFGAYVDDLVRGTGVSREAAERRAPAL